jgi:hypothetical protein
VAALHIQIHVQEAIRKSTREIHASNATVHKHRASGVEPLLGAPHGLAIVFTILLS